MMLSHKNNVRIGIKRADRLCFFGIGVLFSECYHQIVHSIGREPDLLCDNASEKWGKCFFGKKCLSPEEIGRFGKETAVVITIRCYETIYKQLLGMGFENIFLSNFDTGYYAIDSVQRLNGDQRITFKEASYTPSLKNKWTLVTGASRGVGRQIAIAMAKLGSNIIVHSRHLSHVDELVDICSGLGVDVMPIAAELEHVDAVEKMLFCLEEWGGAIDIVFNNAAISPQDQQGFWAVSSDVFLNCYNVNVVAPIRICQHMIPPMIDRGYGRVININTHIRRDLNAMAYACSKAALDKFVYDLSPSLQNTGVAITLAEPGWVRTDAGGSEAPHSVESVIPGILLGALLDANINGCQFSAQEYKGLSISDAVKRAKWHHSIYPFRRWV